MLVCRYLDHESVGDESLLCEVAAAMRRSPPRPMLVTCHRVELYAALDEGAVAEEVRFGGLPTHTISGDEAVLTRLVGVAAGLHSQILGESAIGRQVAAFVHALADDDPMKRAGEAALELAGRLRRANGIEGPGHALLALAELRRRRPCPLLAAVGAGMVGREVAEGHRRLGYERLQLISRDPKRARKRLAGSLAPGNVRSVASLRQRPLAEEYDLVVATDDVPESYRQEIGRLASSRYCLGVVDVSAVPVATGRPDALTLTSPRMKALIALHNAPWLARKPTLLSQARALVRDHLRTSPAPPIPEIP